MPEVADLYAVLRAETAPFTRNMRQASEEGEAFTTRMGGASAMLRKLGAATTLVGVGFLAYGVKAAGDFQQKMNLLVTACGESSKNLKKVSDGVMSLARETGTSTDQLAEGMYQVEKAGYRAGDGLKVLRAAAQGAREEGADLKDVTNAMTSVMASYHLKASDSVRVMNALKTAAGEGKMTMQEFAGSLSTVIPIASANKISFGEVGGAIATLTQHGTSAREATQELASTIRQLAAPNNVAVQEMQRLGLSSTDVSTKLGKRGLSGTLDLLSRTVLQQMGKSGTLLLSSFNKTKQAAADADQMVKSMPPNLQKLATSYAKGSISLSEWRQQLKTLPPTQANLLSQYATLQNKTNGFSAELKKGGPAAQTYTEAIKKLTGGAIGLNTTLQLTGENTEGFKDRVNKVSESFNHASKDVEGWKITQQSFNVQMGRLKEAVNTAAITVGSKLIPVLLKVVTFFEKNKSAAIALAVVIGGVLTAAVISFATTAVTGAVSGVMDLSRGILAAARAIKAFVLSEQLAAAATKVWAGVQAIFNAIMDANPVVLIVIGIVALVAAVVLAYNKIGWFRSFVNSAFRAIAAAVEWVVTFVRNHWQLLLVILTGPIGLAIVTLIRYWSQIRSAVSTAVSWVVDFTKSHWQLLLGLITGPIGLAVGLVVKYWSKIASGLKSAYDATVAVGRTLVSWVSGLPGQIYAYLAGLGGGLSSRASSAWSQFKSATVAKATEAVSWIRGVPGRARAALGNLSSYLYSSGRALLGGFVSGIKSMVSSAVSAAHSALSSVSDLFPHSPAKTGPFSGSGWTLHSGRALMDGLSQGIRESSSGAVATMRGAAKATADAFARTLGIASPSKVFRSLGIYVNEGLVDGLTGSMARVKAATRRIESLLQQTYNRVADLRGSKGVSNKWVNSHEKKIRHLEAYAAKEDKILRGLAAKRDAVAAKIKTAQKKLADLQKSWSDEVKSVSSGIMQGFSVVTDAPQEGFALTAQDVVNKMRDQMAKATQFAAQLETLKKKGLSSDLIAQIAASGVDQGSATATALASANASQIKQINSANAATKKAASAAGKSVADSMYGAGIKSAQGLVKGLQSQEKAIEKQMMKIAKSMQKAIKHALGIHSPSRVFEEIATWIPKGLAKGIDGSAHHATSAVNRLAGSVVGAGRFAGAGLAVAGAGGGGTVVNLHVHIEPKGHVLSTNRELRDLVQQEFARLGMRNPKTWADYKR